ncbi:Uncharacterised protein [uncultured archaeon]|nr:Uncharacterised protein [uncultured archaeon]
MASNSAGFTLLYQSKQTDKLFAMTDDLVNMIKTNVKKYHIIPDIDSIAKTHTLFINNAYKPYAKIACEYIKVLPNGVYGNLLMNSNPSLEFTIPSYGHFISDMVFHIRVSPIGDSTEATASPYYRYCAYPGIRLLKEVKLTLGPEDVDVYDAMDVLSYQKFHVEDMASWDAQMGQQEIREGLYASTQGYTGSYMYRDGAQSIKRYHPEYHWWVPANFWFCQDMSRALPASIYPNTQRKVRITLENINNMIQQVNSTTLLPETLSLTSHNITIELYINNVFITKELFSVYNYLNKMMAIRVHKRSKIIANESINKYLLSSFIKYPTEYMTVGFQDPANQLDPDFWWLMGRNIVKPVPKKIITPAMIYNPTVGLYQLVTYECKPFSTLDKVISTLYMSAGSNIDIYPKNMIESFYMRYLPTRFRQQNCIKAPNDECIYFIPFSVYQQKDTELSGIFDFSLINDAYLHYESSYISRSNVVDLYICASCINLIVNDDNNTDVYHLRYI